MIRKISIVALALASLAASVADEFAVGAFDGHGPPPAPQRIGRGLEVRGLIQPQW